MEKRMIRSKKLRIYVLFAISVDENGSISEMAIKKRTLTMRRKYWRNIGLARDDEEEEEERDLEVVGNIFVFAFRCSFYCCLLLFVFFVSLFRISDLYFWDMLECFTLNVHYVYQVHIISPNLTTISQSMHSPRRCIYIYKEVSLHTVSIVLTNPNNTWIWLFSCVCLDTFSLLCFHVFSDWI